MDAAQEERRRIVSDLERNVTENSATNIGPTEVAEEAQMRGQMEIMNARILQLERQDLQRQSISPPIYSPPLPATPSATH
jgi:hypothetical protein